MTVRDAYARHRQRARGYRGVGAQAARDKATIDDGHLRVHVRPTGWVFDTPPSELPARLDPQERVITPWSSAVNVRARDGAHQRMGGWQQVHLEQLPDPWYGGNFLHAIPAESGAVPFWLIWGQAGLYATDGGGYYLMSAQVWDAPSRTWGLNFHGYAIVGNAVGPAPLAGDFKAAVPGSMPALANWPANWSARLLAKFDNFLVALGMTEDAAVFDDRLRWSQPADPGAVPSTWIPAADNLAGDATLSSPGLDPFTAALQLRNALIVYRARETWIGAYIGPPFVFDWRKLFDKRGAMGPRCVVEAEGVHYVVSDTDIGVHDGVNWRSLADEKVQRWLRVNHATDATGAAPAGSGNLVYLPVQRELWYHVPQPPGGAGNEILVYSLDDREFTIRKATQRVRGMDVGPLIEAARPSQWDPDDEAWDLDPESWNQEDVTRDKVPMVIGSEVANPLETRMRAYELGTSEGLDDAGEGYTAAPMQWALERLSLDLGDPHAVDTVLEIWPRLTESSEGTYVDVRVGYQMRPDDAITWTPRQRWTAGEDKVDVIATGRFISVELVSDATEFVRVEGFDLVYSRAGRA